MAPTDCARALNKRSGMAEPAVLDISRVGSGRVGSGRVG